MNTITKAQPYNGIEAVVCKQQSRCSTMAHFGRAMLVTSFGGQCRKKTEGSINRGPYEGSSLQQASKSKQNPSSRI